MNNKGIVIQIGADVEPQLFSALAGLKERVGGLVSVGQHLAAAFGGFKLLQIGAASLRTAEDMGRLAQRAGETVEAVSKLAYAAQSEEIALGELQMALRGYSEYLVKTGQSHKPLIEAILEQADAFAAIPDGAAKAAKAADLFGRSGAAMIPLLNKGSDEIRLLFDRAEELGVVNASTAAKADLLGDSIDDLKAASSSLTRELAAGVAPGLTELANKLTSLISGIRSTIQDSALAVPALEALARAAMLAAASFAALKAVNLYGTVFGGINSFKDLTAAISLLPSAIAGSGAGLLRLAGWIGAVTVAIQAAIEAWRWWKASKDETKASEAVGPANEMLAKAIRERIDLLEKERKITEALATETRARVDAALELDNAQANSQLNAIARGMHKYNPAPDAPMTLEELKTRTALIDLQIASARLMADKSYLEKNFEVQKLGRLASLREMEEGINKKRELAFKAREEEAISEKDYEELNIKLKRELLDIERERYDLAETERQRTLAGIQADWSLSKAEQYRAASQLATPEELAQMGPNPDSMLDQWRSTMAQLRDEWGTWAQQLSQNFATVFNGAIQSISSGITNLVMGTATWGQALLQIGTTILTSIVQAIVQMGVRWVATQMLMAVAGKAIQSASVASQVPMALASAAIWATPATLATIASYGGAAVAAPGFIAMAQGMTMAQSLAAFEEGGFTGPGGRREVAGVVHRGEYVFSAPAVERMGIGTLDALHDGTMPAGGGSGAAGKPQRVAIVVSDERRADDLRKDPNFETAVLEIFSKNRYRYGA
jgi:hypothetical protein